MTQVICIIPARNEAGRVGAVVEAALNCSLINAGVWVVDDGSTDSTASEALSAGAQVIHSNGIGKGSAVDFAMRQLKLESDHVVLLLDADLTGLGEDHLLNLLWPVVCAGYEQSGGVRDGSLWRKCYWRFHIGLSGERAFRARLFWEIAPLDYQGWSLEVALNSICRWSPKRRKRKIAKVFLDGVDDVSKAKKYGTRSAAIREQRKVFAQWLKGLLRFNLPVKYKHWLS